MLKRLLVNVIFGLVIINVLMMTCFDTVYFTIACIVNDILRYLCIMFLFKQRKEDVFDCVLMHFSFVSLSLFSSLSLTLSINIHHLYVLPSSSSSRPPIHHIPKILYIFHAMLSQNTTFSSPIDLSVSKNQFNLSRFLTLRK